MRKWLHALGAAIRTFFEVLRSYDKEPDIGELSDDTRRELRSEFGERE